MVNPTFTYKSVHFLTALDAFWRTIRWDKQGKERPWAREDTDRNHGIIEAMAQALSEGALLILTRTEKGYTVEARPRK